MSPSPASEQALLVLTTFPDEDVARRVAGRLVEEKLAACVSVLPGLRSHYSWEGKLEENGECLGLVKTRAAAYAALEKRLLDLHPYECPEIIALDISRGSEAYLRWLREAVAPDPPIDLT